MVSELLQMAVATTCLSSISGRSIPPISILKPVPLHQVRADSLAPQHLCQCGSGFFLHAYQRRMTLG
ncbi:hypothetical protein ACBQ54_21085 [Providencia vermicola]|uniref:hypothetical protein n=1 Tax=Providencia vermicola TaxID=333965 RepID=UPI002AB3D742|nr:hypothetical protein [Providencia stuartii]